MAMSKNLRILVIDDNPAIQDDFIKILNMNRSQDIELSEFENQLFNSEIRHNHYHLPVFQIDTASQGQEGIQRIAEGIANNTPYSLAFVDIRMPPGWDGIETIKRIWALDSDIQIVICTAFSDYTWEETIEQLGQRDNLLVLKKPFDEITVRHLSFALTKKWQLMQQSYEYTKQLEQAIQDRTNSLQSSLEKIEYQATHDHLTNLPNRALLYDRIYQAMVHYKRNKTKFGLLFFDIDRFKLINDSFSHFMGDHLLQDIAGRIGSSIREMDTFARLGGDEFVSIITELKDDNYIEKLSCVANKILRTLHQPFKIANSHIYITASIGIAIYDNDSMDAETILRHADTAMYQAKESGGNQFQFYSDDMNQSSLEKIQMESDLYHAIDNHEFTLCYQPQIDLSRHQLISVEALLRWNHPNKGLLLPIDFIPFAEETGQMISIGEWALRCACQQNKNWQDTGLPKFRVSVNLTPKQYKQADLVERVDRILEETGLSAQYLELELSEKAILQNIDTVDTINRLKKTGINIAVDDFGTGYSSLNYLKSLPLDHIKIDHSFIRNIDANRGDETIIKAIISMAKEFNLDVLAEGIETQAQLDFLRSRQCEKVQGYLFSKPLPVDEIEIWMKDFLKHR